MKRHIMIQNVGPIERLTIPLPEAGVVVLRGRNGVGKSHAIAAVDTLVSGRGRPPCRDGAARAVVEGFGARLTIGRSMRRTGEAEVLTLEGRLDISQLVQPPIKDAEAADRTRIKALIQLSGQPADARMFQSILPQGVSLGELVSVSDLSDDPVQLAGQIKRGLEAEARRWEAQAEKLRAEAYVVDEQLRINDADLQRQPLLRRIMDEPDAVRAEAETRVAEALASLRELEARRELISAQAQQIAAARAALAQLEATAVDDPQEIDAEIATVDDNIRRLEQALAVARERRAQLVRRRDEAIQIQRRIAELRQIVDTELPSVSDADIEAARTALDTARRQALETQELIHQAQLLVRRRQLQHELTEIEARAAVYRDAAHATDDVLSQMVGLVTRRLRVEAGRLVCDTDRGTEPYADLSPGERWRIALEIAVDHVGRGGIVTVPQEAWESLDPVNRAEIAAIAHEVGVVILTAEATDDETITLDTL